MPDRPDLLARLALVPGADQKGGLQPLPRHLIPVPGLPANEQAVRINAGKFRPPLASPFHLQRKRILARLGEVAGAGLVLIRAAAGFGKSTLLSQLRELWAANGRPALWINLDAADNDPQRLAAHLDAGLRELDLARGVRVERATGATRPAALLDEIAERQQPFVILLDEFEVLNSAEVLDFVRQLLDALPPCGLLAIATRNTPDLGLGRLRAHGRLLEINADALRFSMEETHAFVHDKHNLSLPDSEIETLQNRTEGWITALHLATLSLQGRREQSEFVAAFSGTHLELAEYLTEDVLSRQSDECRQFLLQTCILNRFCAPLCDALTGRSDSQSMIGQLLRANLFLFPLDSENRWFRYHPLFASFLRSALERQLPGQAPALHRAAASWHFAADLPLQAIEHLRLAGDEEEVARQLDAHLDQLIDIGSLRALLRCIDPIAAPVIDRYPRLVLVHAWTLLLARRYAQAMQVVERNSSSRETETIRCLLLGLTDRLEAACGAAQTQFERLPPEETFQLGLVGNVLAYCLIATARYDEARQVLARMTQASVQPRALIVDAVAECQHGIIELVQGRLSEARTRMQAVAERRRQGSEDRWPAGRVPLDIFNALTLYEADRLDEARHALEDVPLAAMDGGGPDASIISRVLQARMAHLRGDRTLWLHHLACLEQLGRQTDSSRLLCAAWLERARITTLENRLDVASQALHSAELNSDWERSGVLLYGCDVDTPFIARQRLLIARGEHVQAVKALQEAIEDALRFQHHRRALKLRLLHAMALAGNGQRDEALAALTPALQLASREGFLRTFLDEGSRLAKLLADWAVSFQPGCSSLGIAPAFLADLLGRAGVAKGTGSSDADALLSNRELEVLRLSAAGNRNLAIAAKMNLSLHTVKSHLRNINHKLGAEGRTAAIAIARTRGLID
ncbi:LuxR C-terminal-related transcriptional regulator [Pseudomonas jinjuensis]|uniref:LuxR family transcriptional regulator, maltose regulon positive regulatory protein n=1 Tax=Pseudomonas jinjuensis TaxID=198616 RepID=A0A1H0JPG5_9PSED|nr:LuxR C-terminal-related transcriptional regulator [Pseudomonas jinjuensis]SDO45453.1 LuxR family transcriptional regulator, maltose regulon positive regulatory protein [Pseudomonas jinjuensis]